MNDMPTEKILVINQLETKATFAIKQDTQEQVYIPASIAKACEMEVGRIYDAVIAPNYHDRADATPFMAIRIVTDEVKVETPDDDFTDVTEALAGLEFPATADEVGILRNRLERAWRKGKVIKVEARQSPHEQSHVQWALDWSVV